MTTEPKKGVLQRVSKTTGIISVVVAVIFFATLLITFEDASKVIRASIGASAFFFFMVGIVLITMGNTSLPNLKIDLNENNKSEE